ncbi:MAG: DNA-binding domain-containing protein [Bauldia sp.]
MSLLETQSWLRAEIAGRGDRPPPAIYGGRAPHDRLAIYRRNYAVSLLRALMAKFPATHWLLGDATFQAVAAAYVAAHPPRRPALAEYAADFPAFLAAAEEIAAVPYAADLATLDRSLAEVAIAADGPPLAIAALASLAPERLPDLRLRLMTGLRYAALAWPVDDLVRLFLAETRPERLEFEPQAVALEVQGARGVYRIDRLAAGPFAFRRALADGATLGAAAEAAFGADGAFDPGAALQALFADGLVAGLIAAEGEAS